MRWLLAGCMALMACAGTTGDTTPDAAGPPVEPFFGEDLAAAYPEVRNCRFSIEHDAVHIRVRTNALAHGVYVDGGYPFPVGSVVVKEEFVDGACQTPTGFTAMRKAAPGTFTETGGWEWQRLDAERRVVESGALTRCFSCHNSCTEGRDLTCTDP